MMHTITVHKHLIKTLLYKSIERPLHSHTQNCTRLYVVYEEATDSLCTSEAVNVSNWMTEEKM